VSDRSPKHFFQPLAVGAPLPLREIPFTPSRMLHFFDPSNEKMRSKLPDLIGKCDVLLGNLEDAVPSDKKIAARKGLIEAAKQYKFGEGQLWTRVNSLDSPWVLDDMIELVTAIGNQLSVIMVPKVEGAEDIHYMDRLLAQLEARAGIKRPLMLHAILETATGVTNVEAICGASPRMQGVSLGPADLAASRRMKTTRVGGGHPSYIVRADPDPARPDAPRTTAQQDLWHYTLARMVDACNKYGLLPYYGPFGDIKDTVACADQFRNAFLLGCVGAWSLHPAQIEIAREVFSPSIEDVAWAQKVVAAMGDGSGTVMIDGKMQDDATFKQCKVVLNLAKLLAERDPELAQKYALNKVQ
jgi:malyl-CoA/(S)-citramalyl-CoA lyase